MDYDVELSQPRQINQKFSHDPEKYPDQMNINTNMNRVYRLFLKEWRKCIRGTYDDILSEIEDESKIIQAKFKFFQGMWKLVKDAEGWWNLTSI